MQICDSKHTSSIHPPTNSGAHDESDFGQQPASPLPHGESPPASSLMRSWLTPIGPTTAIVLPAVSGRSPLFLSSTIPYDCDAVLQWRRVASACVRL